jgi:hypothetical protein
VAETTIGPEVVTVSPPSRLTSYSLAVLGQAAGEGLAVGQGGARGPAHRQEIAVGNRALGGQVGEIGAQQPLGHHVQVLAGQEVHAGDHGVLGDHQVVARTRGQHRRVVQQAQRRRVAAGQRSQQPLDQAEFVDWRRGGGRRGLVEPRVVDRRRFRRRLVEPVVVSFWRHARWRPGRR